MARRHGNRPNYGPEVVENKDVESLFEEPSDGNSEDGEVGFRDAEEPEGSGDHGREVRSSEDWGEGSGRYAEAEDRQEDEGEPQPESRAQKRIRELIEKNKELEQKFNQLEPLKQELQEWRASQQQAQQQRQPETEQKAPEVKLPKAPDYLDQEVKEYFANLQNYITERERQYQEQLKELRGGYEQQQQYYQQASQVQQAVNKARAMESEFVKQAPDYYDALQYVRDLQVKALTEDYGLPLEQAQAHIQQDEMSRLMNALQIGRNVAEITYNTAKRFGYQPAKKEGQRQRAKPDKSRASLNMGGSPRTSLQDLGEKPMDEFDQAMKELFG